MPLLRPIRRMPLPPYISGCRTLIRKSQQHLYGHPTPLPNTGTLSATGRCTSKRTHIKSYAIKFSSGPNACAGAPDRCNSPPYDTVSPPPLGHHSEPSATPEPQKYVSSPQAPAAPSLSPGTNPSSSPIGATPITIPTLTTRPHPQPVSKSVKRTQKQKPATKVNKPAQDASGPAKATKSFKSISTFAQMFKPHPPVRESSPEPQMDVDWIFVSQGPADVQGGNRLKQLFRRQLTSIGSTSHRSRALSSSLAAG